MSIRNVLLLAAVMSGLFVFTGSTRAGMSTLQQSVTVDHAAGTATFNIDFPHSPDFFTVDASGRPADSFLVEITSNPTAPLSFNTLTTVLNGSEIRFNNNIPARNAFPSVNDKAAGGWGTVRGSVPFTVSGDTLTFTTPLNVLGATNGKFAYQTLTTHFGTEIGSASGSTAVPLPAAVIPGFIMLAVGILFTVRRTMVRVKC